MTMVKKRKAQGEQKRKNKMRLRSARECVNDLIFIVMISFLISTAGYFIALFPLDTYGILALFIGISYIIGFNDGRNDPWN